MEHIKELVKDLMVAMKKSGTSKLTIKNETLELSLERKESHHIAPMSNVCDISHLPIEKSVHLINKEDEHQDENDSYQEEKFITSPVVGTFYHAASTGDAAFVKIGDAVDENTIVGVIEAMKVLNEVKARISGVIVEILVENGQPVEFETKIFRVE